MVTEEEVTRDLATGLPDPFPSSADSNNYKLLSAVGKEIVQHDNDIDGVADATSVRNADSIEELRELGILVSTLPKTGESLESYRARLLAEYATLTGRGTISGLLNAIAQILQLDSPEPIDYLTAKEQNAPANPQVVIPQTAFANTPLSNSEVLDIAERSIAVSYNLLGTTVGTFTYITPSDYNASNFDATKAYDGLDANGNPKDNGGTYAGLI